MITFVVGVTATGVHPNKLIVEYFNIRNWNKLSVVL